MKQYPQLPGVGDVDGFFEDGHLWVQELIAGELCRMQVQSSGALRVGSRRRTFAPGAAPLRYQHAVDAVRESLDEAALREAVDDVESVVFFAVATHYGGVAYDWERVPSVLGVDVWDGGRGEFLSVDATEHVFERVGLDPVNALRKEVHVRDYDPDAPAMPASAWYDGPVAGVVLRKKTGERVGIPNPAVDRTVDSTPLAATADEAAAATATRARFERVARDVQRTDQPVTFDTVYDRLLAGIYREHHHWLLDDDDAGAHFDLGAFRNAVAERTSDFLQAH